MILSDYLIREFIRVGLIVIDPMPDDDAFQPCTVELCLGPTIIYFPPDKTGELIVDRKKPLPDKFTVIHTLNKGDSYVLEPGEFILACSEEYLSNPDWLSCDAKGKSSWARVGITIHQTAGFIDPAFSGRLTFEIVNNNCNNVRITRGDRICQLTFEMIASRVERPYGDKGLNSHYQHQKGAMI